MVIYAEYLFAENFITGAIIIHLTGKLCGVTTKKRWLILGAVGCGLFSFILNLNINFIIALGVKLAFSAGVVTISYYPKKIKSFFKLLCVFYTVSFAMGGITIGLMYLLKAQGVANNTFIYLDHISYLNIISGVLLTYILLSKLAKLIRDRVCSANHKVEVIISVDNIEITLEGLIDTGNYLREPLSNLPTFIMSSSAAKKWRDSSKVECCIKLQEKCCEEGFKESFYLEGFIKGFRLIPFTGIDGQGGNLVGFIPDSVIIKENSIERKFNGIYLAINKNNFYKQDDESYSLLLHRDILDKGIGCYG